MEANFKIASLGIGNKNLPKILNWSVKVIILKIQDPISTWILLSLKNSQIAKN